MPGVFTEASAIIADVIADIDAILAELKTAIDGLDESDLASQDIAIEIQQGLDKDRWFLFAHIAQ